MLDDCGSSNLIFIRVYTHSLLFSDSFIWSFYSGRHRKSWGRGVKEELCSCTLLLLVSLALQKLGGIPVGRRKRRYGSSKKMDARVKKKKRDC